MNIETLQDEALEDGFNVKQEEAPTNTRVQVRTYDGAEFDAFLRYRPEEMDEDGEVVKWPFQWEEADEGTAPSCWSGGAYWGNNADNSPSDPVIGWRPSQFQLKWEQIGTNLWRARSPFGTYFKSQFRGSDRGQWWHSSHTSTKFESSFSTINSSVQAHFDMCARLPIQAGGN